jgi:hypothetical protein
LFLSKLGNVDHGLGSYVAINPRSRIRLRSALS